MINYGIDLGTTNSAIARYEKGRVVVFKHPVTLKDTLPSVVAFRGEKLWVGEKAREYLAQAPQQVAGSFKRKMGSADSYRLEARSYSPVDLSALVLRELKTFIHDEDPPRAAVITIPASFDTLQSNATKAAGKAAGFEQVVLLQEPIAASLAYANQQEQPGFEQGKWLVYDLGGGTFDVALVHIEGGEMRILDHVGDNFLGGDDFDLAIVEQVIVPYLMEKGHFRQLRQELKRAKGAYAQLFPRLLRLAEDAKRSLSRQTEAEIEFEVTDDSGQQIDAYLTLSRSQLEGLMAPTIERTVTMIREMLDRNEVKPTALNFVLMVGGATYTPYVREQVGRSLGVPVDTSIDPTTAIAIGAAYYAGSQPLKLKPVREPQAGPREIEISEGPEPPELRFAYPKATQETSAFFSASAKGELAGWQYRIVRADGGYDSGIQPLKARLQVDLPLVPDSFNVFRFHLLDAQQEPFAHSAGEIGIAQGSYTVMGQPLPHDICLEVDDVENRRTTLEVVFEKNALLPLRRTLTKQATRTLTKGSSERLTIAVCEGPRTALPAANQPLGIISIPGEALTRDLIRGSDIEITLDLSESRDLSVSAYLLMTDQAFEEVFTPEQRVVDLYHLRKDLESLAGKVRTEVAEAEEQANYETAQRLVDLEYEVLEVTDKVQQLDPGSVTAEKYQLEDRKRKLAQQVDELTRDKYITRQKTEYFQTKRGMEWVLEQYQPTEADREAYQTLLQEEKAILATNSSLKIQELIDRINRLGWKVRWHSFRYLKELFTDLAFGRYGPFRDSRRAEELIERGTQAVEQQDADALRVCINQLWELLPPMQQKDKPFGGTGIG